MMERTHENTHNPILPTDILIPDGEAHVMPDGKLYIYGSLDGRDDIFCREEYHVVSTEDMKHWTVYEPSLNVKDIEWWNNPAYPHQPGIDWTNPTPFIRRMLEINTAARDLVENLEEQPVPPLLYAPDCISRDGRYYLYFCMSDDTEGVAVSDRPEGPFRNWKQLPAFGIDPAVFVDDDGQAYYYWGQLFSHGAKLLPDMMTLDESSITDNLVTEEEHYFHEGSSMRKIGNTYYYVYASIAYGKPTSLAYSTSKSPFGPFQYRGVIINNEECDPESWNNHGSIEKFGDQWYVFYHRCSGGTQLYRRLCVEKIEILPDGTIPEVKMTSQGPGEPFGAGETIMGYQACGVYGGAYIYRDRVTGAECLKAGKNGSSAVFRYVMCRDGFTSASIVSRGKGTVRILLDESEAGRLFVSGNDCTNAEIRADGGCYELTLQFEDAEDLFIESITLS